VAAGAGAALASGISTGTMAAVGAVSTVGRAAGISPPGNIDITNCVSLTPVSFGPSSTVDPPPIQFRVIYGHNYTVQTSNLAGAATRAQIQFVAAADPTFANWTSSNISYRRPNNPAPFGVALLSQADAIRVANGLGALWGNRSSLYEAVLPTAYGLGFDIGDPVTVTFPVDDLTLGRKGQVVGERFQTGDPTLTLRILITR
jgi:hypothetical protein